MTTTAGLIALVVSAALTPLVLVLLGRLDVLDHPNERSSHDRPVVRGGGLALAVACLAGFIAAVLPGGFGRFGTGVILAAFASGVVGLAEDLKGVPTLPRFLLQLAAAGAALPWLLDDLRGPVAWQWFFGLGVLTWIVAYVNAFNFMDGINGISAVQSAVAGILWTGLGYRYRIDALEWGGVLLAGACLGFLPFNFPKARLFLGDAGSYFLGAWQAAIVVVGIRSGLPIEVVVAPVALYLADTGTTLLRRIGAGEVWYLPHREHAYQRLIRQGWSHSRTTLLVGLMTGICALASLLSLSGSFARALGDVVLLAAILLYLRLPRLLSRPRSVARHES